MIGGERGLRPLFPWPFAVEGAERLATAQGEFEVAEVLADALGEVIGIARSLIREIVDRCGVRFARERYATTVMVEATGGICREDGRRLTPSAVFFRLVHEALGERGWDDLFQPPDANVLRTAGHRALRRVVPRWREEALARAARVSTPSDTVARRPPVREGPQMAEVATAIVALFVIEPSRVLRVPEIAARVQVPPKHVRPVLKLLLNRAEISRTRGGYRAVERGHSRLSDALEILDPQGVLAAQATPDANRR